MDFPENVRHDDRLLPFAKLLYYELLVAAGTKGYCLFTLGELGRIMDTHRDTVSRSLGALVACKYIRIEEGSKWHKKYIITKI
jgi:hypothetical protein